MNTYVSNQSTLLKEWYYYEENHLTTLQIGFHTESKDYILNVDEDNYKNYLYEKYKLASLHLDEQSIEVQQPRKEVYQQGDNQFNYWACTVACKVEGPIDLWGIKPSVYMEQGRPEFAVSGDTLTFAFNILSQKPEEFNRRKEEALSYLRRHVENINHDCFTFNSRLADYINDYFSTIKAEYLQDNLFFAAINVTPNPDAPKTYDVPVIERRPPIQKPAVTDKSSVADPTINDKTYNDIIDCLVRVGLSSERKPSLYVNRDEEAIRDLFLTVLELSFVGGTVTGETFNRSGKTDILLKNIDDTNLFVGECKVWKGPKHYRESIDQLLDYLTWDDSKAALIIFVKDVALSTVIKTIEQITLDHPSAIKLVDIHKDRFFHFLFSLPQDSHKQVAVQVLLFHFDKTVEGRS